MKLLFLSHTPIGGDFVVGSHHLTRELSRRGHQVFHISTPVSVLHRILSRGPQHRRDLARMGWQDAADGVEQLVPRSIMPSGWGPNLHLRRALEEVGEVDAILLDQPKMFGRAVRNASAPMIYRPTDVYLSGVARQLERAAVRASVGVVATSQVVLEALRLDESQSSMVLGNGVDLDTFQFKPAESRSGFVYVGALDNRFDWEALRVMAELAPENAFDIYGPATGRSGAMPSNVHLRGPVEYRRVPQILNAASVGLLPFSAALENEGRSPMKLYEYLACGLRVLASRSPAANMERPFGVRVYENEASLTEAISVLKRPDSSNIRGVKRAAEMGWDAKALELESFMRDHL